VLGLAVLTLLAVSAEAQTRKPVKPRPKATPLKTAPKPATTAAADLAYGKDKVSIQIKNVTRFVDVLAPIATNIENLDKEAKTRTVDKKILDENTANKTKVVQAIKNIHAGLNALETDFQTKPGLRKYLLKIEGISALCAQSESLAMAGRFTDSRKPLQTVVEKLTDTLAVMQ
jgi:hypothetical protein